MKLDPDTLEKILQSLSMTEDVEIGCEDCFDEMDKYVEMLRQGKDPAKVMPLVQHHLDICCCCQEDFEALLAALEANENNDKE
jgi:hypothetical protein